MTACVVGKTLDAEDLAALPELAKKYRRNYLHGVAVKQFEGRPFGLTAFKDHLNLKCICYRERSGDGPSRSTA